MPRAKPKPFDPTSQRVSPPVIWSRKYQVLLTQDLDIELNTPTGREMLAALSASIESYPRWGDYAQSYPGDANQLAELKGLAPTIERAYLGLRDLSRPARMKITRAYVDGMDWDALEKAAQSDPSFAKAEHLDRVLANVAHLDRAVDCAHNDLLQLTRAIRQAVTNLSPEERRGRKANLVHALIKTLADIFTEYDKGKHDNDASRRSACCTFIRHALTAAHIKPPARLSSLLCK